MTLRARKIWQHHLQSLKNEHRRTRSINGQLNTFSALWFLNRRIWNIEQLLQPKAVA